MLREGHPRPRESHVPGVPHVLGFRVKDRCSSWVRASRPLQTGLSQQRNPRYYLR